MDAESIRVYMNELEEALFFYKTHCILSYVQLEEKYEELTQVVETWKELNMSGETQRTQVDHPAGTA